MANDLTPLEFVAFTSPQSIQGLTISVLTVEAKGQRLVDGLPFIFPQPYLNSTSRTIVIKDREYPMERVSYYVRAKMAKSKDPAPQDHSGYTIGKKAVVPSISPA